MSKTNFDDLNLKLWLRTCFIPGDFLGGHHSDPWSPYLAGGVSWTCFILSRPDFHIFFGGVAQPPTSHGWWLPLLLASSARSSRPCCGTRHRPRPLGPPRRWRRRRSRRHRRGGRTLGGPTVPDASWIILIYLDAWRIIPMKARTWLTWSTKMMCFPHQCQFTDVYGNIYQSA